MSRTDLFSSANQSTKNTSLCEAARLGDAERVAAWLDVGADVNTITGISALSGNPDGQNDWVNKYRTPLMWAVAGSFNLEVVRLLLDHGAQVNAQDKSGWTAAHLAVYNSHRFPKRIAAMMQLLTEFGANLDLRNIDGLKPYEVDKFDMQFMSMARCTRDMFTGIDSDKCFALTEKIIQTATSDYMDEVVLAPDWLQSLSELSNGVLKPAKLLEHTGGCYLYFCASFPDNLTAYKGNYLCLREGDGIRLIYITSNDAVVQAVDHSNLGWLKDQIQLMERFPGCERIILSAYDIQYLIGDYSDHEIDGNRYASGRILSEFLRCIFARLDGDLDRVLGELPESGREAIMLKLTEGVQVCSTGCLERLVTICRDLSSIDTVEEVFYQFRESLVEAVRISMTSNVHATNRIYTIAAAGLGVLPKNAGDVCIGGVDTRDTIKKLLYKFQENFRLYPLVFGLCEIIQSQLCNRYGYVGRKAEGSTYETGEYLNFSKFIHAIFDRDEEEAVTKYLSTDEMYLVVDVDWPKLRRRIEQFLLEGRYVVSGYRLVAELDGIELKVNDSLDAVDFFRYQTLTQAQFAFFLDAYLSSEHVSSEAMFVNTLFNVLSENSMAEKSVWLIDGGLNINFVAASDKAVAQQHVDEYEHFFERMQLMTYKNVRRADAQKPKKKKKPAIRSYRLPNLNKKYLEHLSPLMSAISGATDSLELVRALLARGADVNLANRYGWTALHQLAYMSRRMNPFQVDAIFSFLLQHEVNVFARTCDNHLPSDFATSHAFRDRLLSLEMIDAVDQGRLDACKDVIKRRNAPFAKKAGEARALAYRQDLYGELTSAEFSTAVTNMARVEESQLQHRLAHLPDSLSALSEVLLSTDELMPRLESTGVGGSSSSSASALAIGVFDELSDHVRAIIASVQQDIYDRLRGYLDFTDVLIPFDAQHFVRYQNRTITFHSDASYRLCSLSANWLPFSEQELLLRGLTIELPLSEDEDFSIEALRLKSTLVIFDREIPIELTIDTLDAAWKNVQSKLNASPLSLEGQHELVLPEFNFQRLLSELPSLHFSWSEQISLSDLANKLPAIGHALRALHVTLPEVNISQLDLMLNPEEQFFMIVAKTPYGMLTCCRTAEGMMVKLDGLRTQGFLAGFVDHVNLFHATADIPALSVKQGSSLSALVDLHHSPSLAVRAMAKLVLPDSRGKVRIGVSVDEVGFQFDLALPHNTMQLGPLSVNDLRVSYRSETQKVSIDGQASVEFMGERYSARGGITIRPDGMIEGRLNLHDHGEIYLPILNIYMSRIDIVIKPAADQGVKVGFAGDITLRPRSEVSGHEIGTIQFLPGAALLNSDFEAKFPRGFDLSLSQGLSLLLKKRVSLPRIFDSVTYTGYSKGERFHPLRITYLPSEMRFGFHGAIDVLWWRALVSDVTVSQAGTHITAELSRIDLGIVQLVGQGEHSHPYLSAHLPGSNELGIQNLSDYKARLAARLILFGSVEVGIDAELSGQPLKVEGDACLSLGSGLRSKSDWEVELDLKRSYFKLKVYAELRQEFKIAGETVESATLKIDLKFDSDERSVGIGVRFNVLGHPVSFTLSANFSDLDDLASQIFRKAARKAQKYLPSIPPLPEKPEDLIPFIPKKPEDIVPKKPEDVIPPWARGGISFP